MGVNERRLKSSLRRVVVFMVLGLLPSCFGITTTFHDKPEDTKLPVMAVKMRQEETTTTEIPSRNTSVINATLPSSERQKRLLPYMTFYLAHDFNLPSNGAQIGGGQPQQVYQTQGQRYQIVEAAPKPTTYQQFHNKFTELTNNVGYSNNEQRQPQTQVLYQPKIKYTPFLETNALPGPFHPMRGVPIKTSTPQPNYSQIYEKLAKLKLIQQNNHTPKSYNRYQTFHYQPQQKPPPQSQLNYVPFVEYQDSPQPEKTIIQTYTSTNIDVPSTGDDSYRPQSQQYINSPHQDHVQPGTEEEHKQYIEDTRYVHDARRPLQVPKQQQVVVLRQKPIRVVPHKVLYDDQNNYQEQKQLVYVRKPIPKQPPPPIIEFVIPQKYDTKYVHIPSYEVVNAPNPNKINYDGNVRYEQQVQTKYVQPQIQTKYVEPQIQTKYVKPRPIQDPNYEQSYPEYQVPKYIQPTPNYSPVVKYEHIPYSHKPKQYKPNSVAAPVTYEKVVISQNSDYHNSPTAQAVTTELPYLPTENSNSLSIILKKLQDTNALPHTLTPDNIDNSIKTLVRILSSLKKQQHFTARPIVVADEQSSGTSSEQSSPSSHTSQEENVSDNEAGVGLGGDSDNPDVTSQSFPLDTQEGGTPGKPGVDYPALSTIPKTNFNCKTQRYKGFFGDPDTHCQVWHYCDLNGGQASFLCPNGTIFSQVALTCDWWYNVKCSTTAQLYVLNERLYKYILPLSPKFPEDYSGPLVDRYLALKFKEMEDKMKKQRKPSNNEDKEDEDSDNEDKIESDKTEESESTSHRPMEAINVEDASTEAAETESTEEQ